MSACGYWIDKAKAATGLYEAQLAKMMGTSAGTLGDARRGRTRLPPHVQEKIAILTDVPFEYVLISVASDSAKTAEEKSAWLRLLPENLICDMMENINGYYV